MRSRALCETGRRMKKTFVSGTVALMLAAAAGAAAAGSFSLGAATFVNFPVYNVNFQQNGTALLAETFLLPHRKKGNYL